MYSLIEASLVLIGVGFVFYKREYLYNKTKLLVAKGIIKYVNTRSNYLWNWRHITPNVIKSRIDHLLKIDSDMANINSSRTPSERIFIEEAIEISKSGEFIVSRLLELERLKPLLNLKEHGGFIKLNKNQVFKLFGMLEYPWYLKITYVGHSNVKKRVSARKYTVVYKMEENSPFTFPPYSVNEEIKVGFSAPKIKNCTLITGEYFDLKTAKQYAGLKCDFYECSTIDEIVKNHIDHNEDVVVSLKNKNVVVNDEL